MTIETHIPLLESILGEWKSAIGSQYESYKNHVYRVLNFCFIFHNCQDDDREKLIIAGCFHDLGIWPNDTVDYLPPSIELAKTYLKTQGKEEWTTEITMMIDLHHKFTSVRNCEYPLVEVFRKGDWVDVSQGWRSFGLHRIYIQEVLKTFPNLGFHANLLRLSQAEFKKNPFNPLPMMKW
ncbi:HD domain-containing protein [Roseofilum capinflatum]|uniref:HD domain-containing protein n=1 Tax=Roseofilum capinflatum BLCC-M114 TaxID=3022440 RepID=A0ABT7B245_9CYAN|nr:HD domain-containing protein [Roseofilum capinflatum]MDJ1173199.1 HD domain-containing protein [Roseofilum capinflatum BLCC-M114]